MLNASFVNPYDTSSTDPGFALGTKMQDEFGNVYRLAKAGANALAPGKLCQAPAPDTNVINKTVAATAAIGATSVVIDAGAAVTANDYAGGWLVINDATGESQRLRVDNHGALSGAGELTVNLKANTPVKTALVTDTSEASLYKNNYNGVIVAPTTLTSVVVGWPLVTVTAAYYFWLLVDGDVAGLVNGTPAVGQAVVASATTAGAVDILSTGAVTLPIVGHIVSVGVSTEYKLIKACIG